MYEKIEKINNNIHKKVSHNIDINQEVDVNINDDGYRAEFESKPQSSQPVTPVIKQRALPKLENVDLL